MAIRENPFEPLIALITLFKKKRAFALRTASAIAVSVSSQESVGKTFRRTGPRSRRRQRPGWISGRNLKFICCYGSCDRYLIQNARARPCGLAHSDAAHPAGHHHYASSESERQPGRKKRPFPPIHAQKIRASGALAAVQFRCGFSIERPWVDGVSVGIPSGLDNSLDGGAICRNWR